MNTPALANALAAALATGSVGCTSCAADVEISRDPVHPRLTHLTIHHDEDCPEQAAREARA